MDSWTKVVEWLTVGGSISLVSWVVSWLLEDLAWWKAIKPQYKKLVILALSAVVGLVAKYLQLNENVLVAIKPYLDTFILIATAWIATQVAHKADKS